MKKKKLLRDLKNFNVISKKNVIDDDIKSH